MTPMSRLLLLLSFLHLLFILSMAAQANSSTTSKSPDFGSHYAILNLDFMAILLDGVRAANTREGTDFIQSCVR